MFDHGYNGELMSDMPIVYPAGFDDTIVSSFFTHLTVAC